MTHEFVSVLSVLLTVLLIFVVGVATGFSLGWSRKCLYRYRDVRNQVLDDMAAVVATERAKTLAAARFGRK